MTLEELKNFFKNDRVAMNFCCEIIEADNMHSVVSIDVDERHLNGNNCVQGGVMFTLADFSCAVAANADEIAFVSADGNISFLSAGTGKKLIAQANVIRRGKTLVFCEAVLTDENGKKIAKASFTMCRVRQ
ncbi:MAG: PaaI family thioesterase [Clostridia bacterium]|nr:PaaI family thioesterase [Clostridia bacterium]